MYYLFTKLTKIAKRSLGIPVTFLRKNLEMSKHRNLPGIQAKLFDILWCKVRERHVMLRSVRYASYR